MEYNHEICLMQEVLNEYCADILGFIYRNYTYQNKPLPEVIQKHKDEVIEIKSTLFPQDSIEPLKAKKEQLQKIYKHVKLVTPFPYQ
ncbi:MAG: hypothetical protein IJR70_06150 [Eubacterium sp.]|nr:hypothetical protein [Eubacterium sp.]